MAKSPKKSDPSPNAENYSTPDPTPTARRIAFRRAELADLIVEEVTNGKPLRQICREQNVSKSAIYDWLDDDKDFQGRFACARVRGGHEIADECLEIADDKSEDPASRRVRIETRLKLLAKWNPKQYGERMALTGGDAEDEPIKVAVTNRDRAKAVANLLTKSKDEA